MKCFRKKPESTFYERRQNLLRVAEKLLDPTFRERLIEAYIADTAFLRADVIKREIITPAKLLSLPCPWGPELELRNPLGKVAVMVPKNSLGLTLAKAIASSYLTGNRTVVRLPSQLKLTAPIYRELLESELDHIEFAPVAQSGKEFLQAAFRNPEINAVVIYGDDAWIDPYFEMAKANGTKLLFEGPGNDPLIVMPDADVGAAVAGAIRGGLNNGGQSCSAFERFFVHESISEKFTQELIQQLRALTIGSPELTSSRVGPISSSAVFRRIIDQIHSAVAQGAHLEFGGTVVAGVYKNLPTLTPAVLSRCHAKMGIVSDETFGPVFPILTFSDFADLLPALDDTKYGLNAAVYGTCSPPLEHYLESNHRNVYYNSTPIDEENIESRIVDGGYRRSGFVWEQRETYTVREGRRRLTNELSCAPSVKTNPIHLVRSQYVGR
jgi:acyl-CoA reductase-like NAD-dependent aldehyde dehydrogenase